MQDFAVQRCSRKCSAENRPLDPGERFISAIIDNGKELERIDICESAWIQPPEGCIGWWRAKMPESKAAKRVPAPNQILLETLSNLCDSSLQEKPNNAALAYLLAILLLRNRTLEELHSDSLDYLQLVEPVSGQEFTLQTIELSADEMNVIEEQLTELLFVEQ